MSLGSSSGFKDSHVLKTSRKEKENPKSFVCQYNRSIVSKEEENTPTHESRIHTIPSTLTSLQHLIVYREYVLPCLQLVINYDGLHVFKINSGTQILSHIK